jgi:hypothetical protein
MGEGGSRIEYLQWLIEAEWKNKMEYCYRREPAVHSFSQRLMHCVLLSALRRETPHSRATETMQLAAHQLPNNMCACATLHHHDMSPHRDTHIALHVSCSRHVMCHGAEDMNARHVQSQSASLLRLRLSVLVVLGGLR